MKNRQTAKLTTTTTSRTTLALLLLRAWKWVAAQIFGQPWSQLRPTTWSTISSTLIFSRDSYIFSPSLAEYLHEQQQQSNYLSSSPHVQQPLPASTMASSVAALQRLSASIDVTVSRSNSRASAYEDNSNKEQSEKLEGQQHQQKVGTLIQFDLLMKRNHDKWKHKEETSPQNTTSIFKDIIRHSPNYITYHSVWKSLKKSHFTKKSVSSIMTIFGVKIQVADKS